jgi:Cd2+/Zn2+-exporting ATPase
MGRSEPRKSSVFHRLCMKKNALPPTLEPAEHSCVVENVARILAEEPRLEAVAFEARTRKLAMATLGADTGQRLAKRVSDAVNQPTGSRCGVAAVDGSCSQCGAPIGSRATPGRVVVKQVLGNTLIEKQTCSTAIHFWRWQALRWPKFVPRALEALPAHAADEWKTLGLQAAGCLLAGLAGLAAEHAGAPGLLTLACWLTAYVLGAWEAAEETWEKIRAGALDVHFLMLAVALGAAAIGAWHEGALLLFLFSVSGAMEHYALDRTQKEIGSLLSGAPKTATVLAPDGTELVLPVDELTPGQIVRVTGGQHIPVDVRITKGESTCDESNLTGEARPVPKAPGDEAYSGTLNLHGLLEARVLRPASESALQRVISLIENAQKMRAPAQRFTDRFGTHYTYGVLGLCAAMFFVWWLASGLPAFISAAGAPHSAFYRAMTLLVVASPCALVLSIPSAILSAIAFGARRGILFRGGAALEALAKVDVVALDKTGTLTAGELRLTRAEMFAGDEAELRRVAYNLARFSDHPLSRAIKQSGHAAHLALEEPDHFESLPGQGLRATFGRRTFVLGRRELAAPFLPPAANTPVPADEETGAAEVFVGGSGLAGRLIFADMLRPESKGLLARLHAHQVETIMLTGDRRGPAEHLARELGIGAVRAELLPDQKLAAIEELKQNGRRRVAMIGDGVNDAPSLAAADISVAMGGRGSDAALEQASVILMNDRLENFLVAYDLSRRTERIIRQNLVLALGTVVVMVVSSLCGAVPLALGVAAHEGSTVIVVFNSLRLLFFRPPAGQRSPSAS